MLAPKSNYQFESLRDVEISLAASAYPHPVLLKTWLYGQPYGASPRENIFTSKWMAGFCRVNRAGCTKPPPAPRQHSVCISIAVDTIAGSRTRNVFICKADQWGWYEVWMPWARPHMGLVVVGAPSAGWLCQTCICCKVRSLFSLKPCAMSLNLLLLLSQLELKIQSSIAMRTKTE